jgi:hypothetical protein
VSRTYVDEAIADAQRLIDETVASGTKIRSWYRSRIVTIAVPGTIEGHPYNHGGEPLPITWIGRGRSVLDAMIWLGERECW